MCFPVNFAKFSNLWAIASGDGLSFYTKNVLSPQNENLYAHRYQKTLQVHKRVILKVLKKQYFNIGEQPLKGENQAKNINARSKYKFQGNICDGGLGSFYSAYI